MLHSSEHPALTDLTLDAVAALEDHLPYGAKGRVGHWFVHTLPAGRRHGAKLNGR